MMKATIRDWFDTLDNPDNVGASEYRDLYDNLDSALCAENYDGDEDNGVGFANAILDEFISYAQGLKENLNDWTKK